MKTRSVAMPVLLCIDVLGFSGCGTHPNPGAAAPAADGGVASGVDSGEAGRPVSQEGGGGTANEAGPGGSEAGSDGGGSGGPTALRSADVQAKLGVNIQASSGGPNVDSPSGMVDDLNYIGIRMVREDVGRGVDSVMTAIAQAGIKLLALPHENPLVVSTSIDLTKAWANAYGPSALAALEGPNEPDSWPATYNGMTGGGTGSWLPLAQYMHDLYAAVRADPVLKGVPVWGMSDSSFEEDDDGLQFLTIPGGAGTNMPDGTVFADAFNIHVYADWNGIGGHGAPPLYDGPLGDNLEFVFQQYAVKTLSGFAGLPAAQADAQPRVITESGISTQMSDDATIGKNLLNGFLDAAFAHYSGFFIYQLYPIDNYQMMDGHGAPRPCATYFHNLWGVVGDTGATASTFAPTNLLYSLSGAPPEARSLLLEKSDGTFELILWTDAGTTPNGGSAVTVTLDSPATTLQVFDPTVAPTAAQTQTNAASVTVQIEDHPLVVQVSP